MIDKTGARIGSETDTGADTQAYGASTLHAEHVTIDGATVTFTFVGKKGVDITKELFPYLAYALPLPAHTALALAQTGSGTLSVNAHYFVAP